MGAAVGTLFAVGGTLLFEALASVPAAAALATTFLIDFAGATTVTAVGAYLGFSGVLTETLAVATATYGAIQAVQGGVLGVLTYLGATELVTSGIIGLATALTLFGGGVVLGYQLFGAPFEGSLVSPNLIHEVIEGRKFLSLNDVIFKQLRNTPQAGQQVRVRGGRKRGREVFDDGGTRSVRRSVRRTRN